MKLKHAMHVVITLACGAAGLAIASVPVVQIASVPVVQTEAGAVSGAERNEVFEYRGIPFAAPPVGALRWALPHPPAAWTGVRDGTAFGPACPQQARFNLTEGSTQEDCLSLNVSVPRQARLGKKLPVLLTNPHEVVRLEC